MQQDFARAARDKSVFQRHFGGVMIEYEVLHALLPCLTGVAKRCALWFRALHQPGDNATGFLETAQYGAIAPEDVGALRDAQHRRASQRISGGD